MLSCARAHTGLPPRVRDVGVKPPSNQPQVTCFALSRLPMFVPFIRSMVVLRSEQPS